MRNLRRVLGLALFGFGVFVAIYPFASTWRMATTVLDQLPPTPGVEVSETNDRFGTAIMDSDFTLARRTYQGATIAEVEAALAADGFERYTHQGEVKRIKDCCGGWDGVIVRLTDAPEETAPGTVLAVVTVSDSDVQLTWGFLFLFGLLIAFLGLVLLLIGSGTSRLFIAPETVNT